MAHPPRSKPPLRSSSGPPSPCITPSTETFVVVVSFMVFLSLVALLSDPTERTHRSHREPGHGSRTHTRHPLGGDRLVRIFGEAEHHRPTERGVRIGQPPHAPSLDLGFFPSGCFVRRFPPALVGG